MNHIIKQETSKISQYFGSLSPHITIPTKKTPHSRTLIGDVFTNTVDEPSINDNSVCSISAHVAQLFIYLKYNPNTQKNKKQDIKETIKE